MADTSPQFEHGPSGDPTSPPLAQGAATALNEAARPASAQPEAPPAPAGTPGGPAPAGGPAPPSFSASSDEEKFLYAPTGRPDEPVTSAPGPSGAAPSMSAGDLFLLGLSAQDPSAPSQVRDLFTLLANS